MDDTIV